MEIDFESKRLNDIVNEAYSVSTDTESPQEPQRKIVCVKNEYTSEKDMEDKQVSNLSTPSEIDLDSMTKELLSNYRLDRDRADKFIGVLMDRISNDDTFRPKRVYYEALVEMFRTRSELNQNLIRLIEVTYKKLSDGSNNSLLNQLLVD